MKKNINKKAFSLFELSMVILIIGILVAGITLGSIMVRKFRISAAQMMTSSSPINGIKDSALWLETSVDTSFGATELSDGNAITSWADARSNSTNKPTITAAGTGPTYSNTINHVHAVKFTGSSANHLQIADASFLNNTDYTIIILEKRQSSNSNNYFFGQNPTGTANQNIALGYSADGAVLHSQGSNSYTSNISSYASTTDRPRMFVFIHDSTQGKKTYIDGVLAAQSADTTPLTGITTNLPIGKSYTGEIGEIAIFTRALKAEERKSIEDYLGKKWSAKILRESVPGGSCTTGMVTGSGCTMACSTSAFTGASSPASIADGQTATVTCGQTGYSGTTSLTCSGGGLTGSACPCDSGNGYVPSGGSCVQQCTVSVNGSNVTSVASGVTQVACNAGGNYGTTPLTFAACSGSAITGSCACVTGYTGSTCGSCDTANDYNIPSWETVCRHKCTVNGVTGINNGTKADYTTTSRTFSCNATGYTGSTINYTCDGTNFAVVGAACGSTPLYVVLSSGTSYTVPAGYTQAKVWAVGAGGGGGGATSNDGTAGGGGGAGGVAYKTWTVTTGSVISYSIGTAGAGGYSTANGTNGGNTTVTYNAVTITGGGGGLGRYNSATAATGGTFSGGDGGANGGGSPARSGDVGGSSGGAIGGVAGVIDADQARGANGVNSANVSGLHAAVTGAGQAIVSGGAGNDGSGPGGTKHGSPATGFGCSGGGAGYYGGSGGAGKFGGGGGGAAGLSAEHTGGAGGGGAVVINFF